LIELLTGWNMLEIMKLALLNASSRKTNNLEAKKNPFYETA